MALLLGLLASAANASQLSQSTSAHAASTQPEDGQRTILAENHTRKVLGLHGGSSMKIFVKTSSGE